MKRYLDPKNYITFNKIFGQHENLLISFLNAMLELNSPIVSVNYLPEELVPSQLNLDTSFVNGRCMDADCRSFIVSIQMVWRISYFKLYVLDTPKKYSQPVANPQAETVYVLSIVNEKFNEKPSYWQRYTVLDIDKQQYKIDGVEFVFIELPKFKEQTFFKKSMQVHWLQFLTIEEGPLKYMSIQVPEINETPNLR